MESGVDLSGDRTGWHSDSDGARCGRGSLDQGRNRHESADMEEGAERATLFYVKRKIGQGEGRESGRRRPRVHVMSGGIGIGAATPDIGE